MKSKAVRELDERIIREAKKPFIKAMTVAALIWNPMIFASVNPDRPDLITLAIAGSIWTYIVIRANIDGWKE